MSSSDGHACASSGLASEEILTKKTGELVCSTPIVKTPFHKIRVCVSNLKSHRELYLTTAFKGGELDMLSETLT